MTTILLLLSLCTHDPYDGSLAYREAELEDSLNDRYSNTCRIEPLNFRTGFYLNYDLEYQRCYLINGLSYEDLSFDIGVPENGSNICLAGMYNFYKRNIPIPDYGIRLELDFGIGPSLYLSDERVSPGIMFTFGSVHF